jgi:type IV pilus assembly protein PilB
MPMPAVALPRPIVMKFRDELLARSSLTAGEFHSAVRHAELQSMALPDALVAMAYLSEEASYAALGASLGVPLVDLDATRISPLAIRLVPERVARRHTALAMSEDNRTLTYATAHPFDAETDQDVSFASGRVARPALARPTQLAAALDRFYPRLTDVDRLLGQFRTRIETIAAAARTPRNASPIIELCDQIVAGAISAHASDVHVEPQADGAVVRFRVDGILETVFTVPHDAVASMTNRFKVMAKTDIASRHRPQDGAFTVSLDGREVFVRLSTMPTIHGEKIVLRVIDSEHRLVSLDSLGYEADSLDRLRRSLERPDGLVLVTGPTGSGKTTVLYAALAHLRDGRRSIVSVEDPVERRIDGVNQIPVNVAAGASFAAVLKSVLRQDPNVMMVGEVRDGEVAQIVGQAAYTGHLVLTSMHTIDAASAMTRLMNLGLEPYKVAESLTAVVAQRLVRRLCPHCSVSAQPERQPGVLHVVTSRRRPGPGCKECKLTGYIDRVAVAEVFTPTEAMRTAIARGMTALELRKEMKASGHRFMRDVALRLVDEGVTSIEEVNRVLAEAEGETERAAAEPTGRKRILIADDDRMIRMLVKVLLQREGYDVMEAENGREALDLAQVHRFDLMITDLMMPEVDGYATLSAVRTDPRLARLPVIVLTAEIESSVERTVLDLGADDYLVKPFDADVFLKRVQSVFVRRLALAS